MTTLYQYRTPSLPLDACYVGRVISRNGNLAVMESVRLIWWETQLRPFSETPVPVAFRDTVDTNCPRVGFTAA